MLSRPGRLAHETSDGQGVHEAGLEIDKGRETGWYRDELRSPRVHKMRPGRFCIWS